MREGVRLVGAPPHVVLASRPWLGSAERDRSGAAVPPQHALGEALLGSVGRLDDVALRGAHAAGEEATLPVEDVHPALGVHRLAGGVVVVHGPALEALLP